MIGSAETISTHYLYRYICHKKTAKQSFFFIWEKLRARQYHRLFGAYLAGEKQWRSVYALLLFSLALAFVNAFSTEEHVKRFFRPDHTALLPQTTSLEFRDEPPALLTSSQNDESTIKVLGSLWAILWEAGCTSIFNGKQSELTNVLF